MKKKTKNTRYLQLVSLISGCILTVMLTRLIEKAFPEKCNHPDTITHTDTISIRIEYPERPERYRRKRHDSINENQYKNKTHEN